MHILISVDMEGIAGVVHPADVRPGEPDYERNRHLMTAEANAAIRGALRHSPHAAVSVADAHAQFRNLVPSELDRRAVLTRGRPRAHGMLAGIDTHVDAIVFVGYHGKAGTPHSVLAHTINGAALTDVRCNGRSLGEIGLNTALATHHGAVPVLVTGDDTVGAEATETAAGIHTVEVKRACGGQATTSLHPDEASERIEAALPAALDNRDRVQPLALSGTVNLEVDLRHPTMVDAAMLLPGTRRLTGTTVSYHASDIATGYDVVELIAMVGGAVQ